VPTCDSENEHTHKKRVYTSLPEVALVHFSHHLHLHNS